MVLYSGGLDSILACRVLQEQGIRVTAVKFVTPFFGDEAADDPQRYIGRVQDKYGIRLVVKDITDEYLPMLRNPEHGYGKNFNPCIDCKILMIHKTLELMPEYDADFIATGEVIGQRPMSQRKDTLNCIRNESRAQGLLLRPLCARSLKPTIPEELGWVSREDLPHISGRGRKKQIELAEKFGITDYPNPAGGCRLADPIQGRRLKEYFRKWPEMDGNDCRLAVTGRQFILPGGWWLVLGRDKAENERLWALKRDSDLFLHSKKVPAPAGILRNPLAKGQKPDDATVKLAAAMMLHYCRKCQGTLEVQTECCGKVDKATASEPLAREKIEEFAVDTN